MPLTAEQELAVREGLNGGIQFGLPQTVVKTPKYQRTIQTTQYDPVKLQALKDALAIKRPTVGGWESFANSLAQAPEARSFTGGFGEEIINPWAVGLSSLARGFGGAYSNRAQSEREAAEKAREDAIKMAEVENEAAKQNVAEQYAEDWMKVNDPNAKLAEAQQERINTQQTLDVMMKDLEDIGTRFDEQFKNIDEMQRDSTRWGRMVTGGMFGIGTTDEEKLARDQFKAWKSSMQNMLVNANRQAGSGSMSDADAERYEQKIRDAKNPAEARNILDSFVARMSMTPLNKRENILDKANPYQMSPISQAQSINDINDIWNMIPTK